MLQAHVDHLVGSLECSLAGGAANADGLLVNGPPVIVKATRLSPGRCSAVAALIGPKPDCQGGALPAPGGPEMSTRSGRFGVWIHAVPLKWPRTPIQRIASPRPNAQDAGTPIIVAGAGPGGSNLLITTSSVRERGAYKGHPAVGRERHREAEVLIRAALEDRHRGGAPGAGDLGKQVGGASAGVGELGATRASRPSADSATDSQRTAPELPRKLATGVLEAVIRASISKG